MKAQNKNRAHAAVQLKAFHLKFTSTAQLQIEMKKSKQKYQAICGNTSKESNQLESKKTKPEYSKHSNEQQH